MSSLAGIFALLLTIGSQSFTACAQGTAFTYQGCLNSSGSAASGSYDFIFALFNSNSVTSGQIGATRTNLALAVSNGLFTTTLDFGSVFAGNAAWLAIGVRSNGESGFATLNPLQPVTPAPYAIYAASASSVATNGVVPLAALPASIVTNGAGGVTISGIFTGNGSGLTNTVTAGNYVFAHDDAIGNGIISNGQTKALSYSAVNVAGWPYNAASATFTCSQSGLYLVYYYVMCVNTGGLALDAYTPGAGQISGSMSYSNVTGRASLSQSFLAFFNAGDALQIQATAASNVTVTFVGPSIVSGPDATLTIVRIQ